MVLGALSPACASSGAVKAAERGDYPALKQLLSDEFRAQKLDGKEARRVAHAVVDREIREAQGPDAVARVDEVRLCAKHARDILERRAHKDDEGGARAAFVLVDERLEHASRWVDRASSPDAGWRAVGARGLVDGEHGELRRQLFVDMDARVRRGAFGASVDAGDPADAPLLLESIRLDPDPTVRSLATRAAGGLGGRDVVMHLKDRWLSADGDEPLRSSISVAWGLEPSFDAGGRDELVWAAETEHGAPAVSAATTLLRRGGEGAEAGRAALARAVTGGPSPVRVMAINLSDMSDGVEREAVTKASQDPDGPVKVAALDRLTDDAGARDKALAELGTIAAGSSKQRNAARSALARAKDRRVVLLLADDLGSPEPGVRAWAAQELSRMREFPQAAQVLADPVVTVRMQAACAILAMPR